MTLFTKRLALDVVGRVWDVYLLDSSNTNGSGSGGGGGGEEVVYRVGVAILKALSPQLIDQPFERAIKLLGVLPQELNEDALFSALNKITINSATKDLLKVLHQEKA